VRGQALFTTEDFEKIHWHDNAIHGFRIVEGDDGCTGQLIFDIDYISEWLRDTGDSFSFKIIPSDLTFHDVSDLVISIDYAALPAALQPMCISEIKREVVVYPNGHSSFQWEIELNWPSNSFFKFRASDFTQVPRVQAVISESQYLLPAERAQQA
jgi:hypothetical protein